MFPNSPSLYVKLIFLSNSWQRSLKLHSLDPMKKILTISRLIRISGNHSTKVLAIVGWKLIAVNNQTWSWTVITNAPWTVEMTVHCEEKCIYKCKQEWLPALCHAISDFVIIILETVWPKLWWPFSLWDGTFVYWRNIRIVARIS